MYKLQNYQDIKQYFNVPDAAIAFLESATVDTPNGRHEFNEDCYINVMNSNTKTEQGAMEAHEVFVDVQCLIAGEEKILVADKTALPVHTPYNPAKDAAFYDFDAAETVTYTAGECVVLYPNEAHLPCLAVNEPMTVKKAVMKLHCKHLSKN